MSVSTSILLFGQDATLLFTRCAILQKAGFQPVSASNLNDVHALSSSHPIRLLIICQTISEAEGRMALSIALAFNPRAAVLALNDALYEVPGQTGHSVPVITNGNRFLSGRNFLATVEEAMEHGKETK